MNGNGIFCVCIGGRVFQCCSESPVRQRPEGSLALTNRSKQAALCFSLNQIKPFVLKPKPSLVTSPKQMFTTKTFATIIEIFELQPTSIFSPWRNDPTNCVPHGATIQPTVSPWRNHPCNCFPMTQPSLQLFPHGATILATIFFPWLNHPTNSAARLVLQLRSFPVRFFCFFGSFLGSALVWYPVCLV